MARTQKSEMEDVAPANAAKTAAPRRKAAAEPGQRQDRRGNGDDSAPGKVVGAVAGAIKILRYLAESRVPVGVSRIAKDTKLNTSTSFNILRTLAMEDFVHFDAVSKTYSLSLGIMEIAKGATALGGDIGSLRPAMERIAHEHGVTVTLWQPVSEERKVLILSALTRNAMRIQMQVGQRLPILMGATGRVFAAFSDEPKTVLKRRFNEIRWDRPLSFDDFLAQAKETREKGYAMDRENFAMGTVSMAVPIFDRDGRPIMAVTATMFSGQYRQERVEEIVDDLKQFAVQAGRVATG
ncbi:MAG: IclR family transcriptional regulator [Rhizobiaceae bacterium]